MKKKLTALVLCLCLTLSLLAGCNPTEPNPSVSSQLPSSSAAEVSVASSQVTSEEEPVNTAPVSLQDDFYAAINETWLATAEIPSDQPAAGVMVDLTNDLQTTLMQDFDQMAAGDRPMESKALENFIDFYKLAMDFEAIDAAGAGPILPLLDKIEALENLADFESILAQWLLDGGPSPIEFMVMADMKNTDLHALYTGGPSLFLPDVSFYDDDNPNKALLIDLFSSMASELLVLSGKTEEDAAKILAEALAFDERLVPYTPSAEDLGDSTSIYNPIPIADFAKTSSNLDLNALIERLTGSLPSQVICATPDYFEAFDTLVNPETFQEMKSWMQVNLLTANARYLSIDFVEAASTYDMVMTGVTELPRREDTAYTAATALFSEVVGLYYGQTYFGDEARDDVTAMVEELLAIFKTRLEKNTWLSDATREAAIKKLDNMAIKVGYPEAIDPFYDEMTITGSSFFENRAALSRMIMTYMFQACGTPVNRDDFPMTADTVNAAYDPTTNSICFPAAFLQAPMYNKDQSKSANYGGIGGVIGHEITHAFDPNGAKFDERGNMADWWTPEDLAEFEARSQKMVDHFDGVPYANGTVNGRLTLGENVADLGGYACALEATMGLPDADPEVFFTNMAASWCIKYTPEYEELLLTLDSHAPSKLRVNLQVQQFDAFYTTFDVTEGDGMYLAPEDRIEIW